MAPIRVVYHREGESWWAESPDVDGYTAAAASLSDLRGLVRGGLPFLLDTIEVMVDEYLEDGARLDRWPAVFSGFPKPDVKAANAFTWVPPAVIVTRDSVPA